MPLNRFYKSKRNALSNPRVNKALDRIHVWIAENQDKDYIDPERIIIEAKSISETDMAEIIAWLVNNENYVVRYKVLSPYTNTLCQGTFESPDIDEEVKDGWENSVDPRDSEIVPVLVREACA